MGIQNGGDRAHLRDRGTDRDLSHVDRTDATIIPGVGLILVGVSVASGIVYPQIAPIFAD